MKLSTEDAKRMMSLQRRGLSIADLRITELPEHLIVPGTLDLSFSNVKELPQNLVVGRSLDLRRSKITKLPNGLTVGGSIYLCDTNLEELPEDLTVGRYLDLRNSLVRNIPQSLKVGKSIRTAYGEEIRGNLQEGDYVPRNYIFSNGILNLVKHEKVFHGYTFYVGKIPKQHVITDGTRYTRCSSLQEGIRELAFLEENEKGTDQYKGLTLDSILPTQDLINMYRVITGACRKGTNIFISSLSLKGSYSIREAIEITRGQYGSNTFEKFFL